MATYTITSTPTTLDPTGAVELGVTNNGLEAVLVNATLLRPGQRRVFDTSTALQAVTAAVGVTSSVDVMPVSVAPSPGLRSGAPPWASPRRPHVRRSILDVSPVTMNTTMQTGHGWTATTIGSSNLNDTTDYVMGSQSAQVTTTTTATTFNFDSPTFATPLDLTGRQLRVLMKLDNVVNVSNLRLYAGDAAMANAYQWQLQTPTTDPTATYFKEGEWQWITLSFADAPTLVGAPTRNSISKLRFRCAANNGTAFTLHVQAVALIPTPTAWPTGVLTLTFDDAYASHATIAAPYLADRGMAGTAFPIRDQVGQPGRLTVADCQRLRRFYRWEFGAHSDTLVAHTSGYPAMTLAAALADLDANRQWLYDNDLGDATGAAWPIGKFTTGLAVAVAGRVAWCRANTNTANPQETLPPSDPLRLRSLAPSATTTLASMTALIDQAYANAGWLCITIHDIAATASGATQMPTATFTGLVDYAVTRGIPVRTISQILDV
jgi:peptidoglycan/xylan/chitin deacetylase (PgdA/CDA1 family)